MSFLSVLRISRDRGAWTADAAGALALTLALAASWSATAAARIGSSVPLGETSPRWTGAPISLDVKGADFEDFLRLVADVSGLDLVIDPSARGRRVSVVLDDVPWDQALDLVLRTQGLVAEREGTVVRIAPAAKLVQERQAARALAESRELALPLLAVRRTLSHGSADAAARIVEESLSARGSVVVDRRTNTLIIRDVPSRLEEIAGRIGTDPPHRATRPDGRYRSPHPAGSPAFHVEAQLHAVPTSVLPPGLARQVGPIGASLHQTVPLLRHLVTEAGPPLSRALVRLALDEVTDLRLEAPTGSLADVVLALSPRRDGSRTVLTVRETPGRGAGWHAPADEPHVVLLPGSGRIRHVLVILPVGAAVGPA